MASLFTRDRPRFQDADVIALKSCHRWYSVFNEQTSGSGGNRTPMAASCDRSTAGPGSIPVYQPVNYGRCSFDP